MGNTVCNAAQFNNPKSIEIKYINSWQLGLQIKHTSGNPHYVINEDTFAKL